MSNGYISDEYLVAILAGGGSRRFGGRWKGGLLLHGRPLISSTLHAVQTAAELAGRKPTETLIVTKDTCLPAVQTVLRPATRETDATPLPGGAFPVSVLPDHYPEDTPLSGILTAYDRAGELGVPWLLILPCDMPLIEPAMLALLHPPVAEERPHRARLFRRGDFLQPFPGVYPLELKSYWKNGYENGDYRLTRIVRSMPVDPISEPIWRRHDPSGISMLNINTPKDLVLASRCR